MGYELEMGAAIWPMHCAVMHARSTAKFLLRPVNASIITRLGHAFKPLACCYASFCKSARVMLTRVSSTPIRREGTGRDRVLGHPCLASPSHSLCRWVKKILVILPNFGNLALSNCVWVPSAQSTTSLRHQTLRSRI